MNTLRISDNLALNQIALLLDGTEWNADTIDSIAKIVRSTGRPIRDRDDLIKE